MKRITAALLAVLVHSLASGAEALPDERGFMDSVRLDRRFSAEMTRLEEAGECADGEALLAQLRAEKRYALDLPAAGEASIPAGGDALYRLRAPSVVGVGTTYLCGRCDHPHARLASGVIVGADGYILTNYHVVEAREGNGALGVITFDGRVFPVREILASSKRDDIALLKVEAEGLPAVPVAGDVAVGERVAAISNPVQHYFVYTEGVVSSKLYRRMGRERVRQLAITADYAKGSSGAPIFNLSGEVVGLVHSTSTVHYGEGRDSDGHDDVQMVWKYCVPYTAIHDLLAPAAAAEADAEDEAEIDEPAAE